MGRYLIRMRLLVITHTNLPSTLHDHHNVLWVPNLAEAVKRLQGASFDALILETQTTHNEKHLRKLANYLPMIAIHNEPNCQPMDLGAKEMLTTTELNILANNPTIFDKLLNMAVTSKRAERKVQKTIEQLTQMELTEPITKLLNPKGFAKVLAYELARSRRENSHLACAYLSIDGYTTIKEKYGDLVAGQVTRETARRIAAAIRTIDHAGILDDSNFMVLFVKANKKQAEIPASRLRDMIKDHQFIVDQKTALTTTISIAITDVVTGSDAIPKMFENTKNQLEKYPGTNRLLVI